LRVDGCLATSAFHRGLDSRIIEQVVKIQIT
jgi:hypothetical protein